MNCLVTGGAGFIGTNLVKSLLDRGHSVRILDNFSTGKRDNIGPFQDQYELFEGDLRSYHIVHEAARDIEVIFHQGALPSVPRSINDPITTNQVNVEGTLNILNAALDNGVRRVVYASSSSIYGENPALPKLESMAPRPISPYAVTKLAGEHYCQVFFKTYGLETVCLRYFNVFGLGQDPKSQYAAVIPLFITAFLEGGRITVNGDGDQSRDFTYIENVIQANLLAAEASGATGEAFNIACGIRTSLNKILDHLRKFTEVNVEVAYESPRTGDVKHSLANIEKAQKILRYYPKVSVKEGLLRSVEYYRTVRKR